MINWDKFNECLSYADNEVILQVIEMFINDYPEKISNLQSCVEEKNYTGLDAIAHPLKSNCATFGDKESAKFAYNLELMGKKKVDNNKSLANTDSWTELEKWGTNDVTDNMKKVFSKFVSASGQLVEELDQYRKLHSL
jgi:HPt (histidine-containing phosphotransfer) domain-containing protein